MDSSPPGSSVHGFPQGRLLGWVAIFFSRNLSYTGVESSYLGLLHWQADSLLMSHRGNPQIDEVIKGTFICPLGKCLMHVCVYGGMYTLRAVH